MKKNIVIDWFPFFAKKFYLLAIIVGLILRIVMILLPQVLSESFLADFAE